MRTLRLRERPFDEDLTYWRIDEMDPLTYEWKPIANFTGPNAKQDARACVQALQVGE